MLAKKIVTVRSHDEPKNPVFVTEECLKNQNQNDNVAVVSASQSLTYVGYKSS